MSPSSADSPAALVDRRAALLSRRPRTATDDEELEELTARLGRLLDSRRRVRALDAGGADRALVRRLASLEPVNPVRDEADLADRCDTDRRVFVLEHPVLGGRPLNVVWVALCRGVPSALADVLDPADPPLDPGEADTAVFYSIWNVEPGLVGLGRGLELIERAVDALRVELPVLGCFVTLSPVPGLRRWAAGARPGLDAASPSADLAAAAAAYLCSRSADGRMADPVARFHLGNGARLWRVLPGADPSPLGIERSFGVMANYRYDPEDRAANRELLDSGGVAVGPEVEALLDER